MKADDIAPLLTVSDAVYQKELRAISDILTEEGKLRRAIVRLNESRAQAPTGSTELGFAMQATGAETAWRMWLERRLTELNAELARLLARKAKEMEKVRRAFGQREALAMLETQLRTENQAS
ncbi:MAG: hypothetical protein AB3N23_02380 [Paracoccaceae bacterium]